MLDNLLPRSSLPAWPPVSSCSGGQPTCPPPGCMARPARARMDAGLRDPRPELRAVRADGDPRPGAPARGQPRAARVRRRLAAAPAPARASGAVMLAFTGLLLPGLLLLHGGRLPAAQPAAHTTKVVRKVVVRKVVHERTVVVREAVPARARAGRPRGQGGAGDDRRGSEGRREEGGTEAVAGADRDRREEDDLDAGGDHEDHPRRSGASRPGERCRSGGPDRCDSGRRDRRGGLSLRPRRVLRRCVARASREGSRPGRRAGGTLRRGPSRTSVFPPQDGVGPTFDAVRQRRRGRSRGQSRRRDSLPSVMLFAEPLTQRRPPFAEPLTQRPPEPAAPPAAPPAPRPRSRARTPRRRRRPAGSRRPGRGRA